MTDQPGVDPAPSPPRWQRAKPVPLDRNGITGRAAPRLPADFASRDLFSLLRDGVAHDPTGLAMIGAGESLTWADLLDWVGRFARMAARAPTGPIAAILPDTPRATAAILGCLVARRVVLVIDPLWPPTRIATLLVDAGEVVTLRTSRVDADPGLALHDAEREPPILDWAPAAALDPDEPATVFYTSGSTGRPKGIVTSLWGNLNRARIGIETWRMGPGQRMLNTSPATTHSSFCRMLAAVCAGTGLVHYTTATDGLSTLLSLLETERPDILVAGPAILRTLIALPRFASAARSLQVVRVGGAAVLAPDVAAARAVLPAGCVIDHSYASTEAGIVAQWAIPQSDPPQEARLPSGYPLDSLEYAFTPEDELIVRGRGVALGEWVGGRCVPGRMEPVPGQPNWRLFRTGDLARIGEDGLLRFLARADRQLNLNGVRIEPAEIEAALRQVPGVIDVAVLARPVGERLVLMAFVAGTGDPAALRDALRDHAGETLTTAMRPSRYVVLPALPRMASGKVDMTALERLEAPGG